MSDYNEVEFVESNIIGAVMRDESLLGTVLNKISAEDFSISDVAQCWGAIYQLYSAGDPVNVVTVAEKSSLSVAWLADVAKESISTDVDLVCAWIEGVVSRARKHRLSCSIANALNLANNSQTSTEDVLNAVRSTLTSAESSLPRKQRSLVEIIRDRVDALDARHQGTATAMGVKTGLRDVDNITYGLCASELILLAARPGMGKTALATAWAANAAIEERKNVAFFSLEMSADELVDRILIQRSKNEARAFLNPKKYDVNWSGFNKPVADLKECSLQIFDDIFDIEGVIAKCREIHRKNKIECVFIDYLQLLTSRTSNRGGNRVQEVSDHSRALKMLAMSLGCPVVALSQLNRAVEGRPNKRPLLADLRESGSLEQDANKVVMIYRDEVYNEDSQTKEVAEILIRKNRGGALGSIPVRCVMSQFLFENLTHDYEIAPSDYSVTESPYA